MIPSLDVQIFDRPEAGLALSLDPEELFPEGLSRWEEAERELGMLLRAAHHAGGREFSCWFALKEERDLWGGERQVPVFWICPEQDFMPKAEGRAMERCPKDVLENASLWGRQELDEGAQPLWLIRGDRLFRVWLGSAPEPVILGVYGDEEYGIGYATKEHPSVNAEDFDEDVEHAFLWTLEGGLLANPWQGEAA